MGKRIAAFVVVALAAWVWWWVGDEGGAQGEAAGAGSSSSNESGSTTVDSHRSGDDPGSAVRSRRDGGTDGAEAQPAANVNAPEPTPTPTDPARAAAEAYRNKIREALQDDIARASSEEREFDGRLDPQYIRDAVGEIRPLLIECYEMAVQAAEEAGEPVPEGQLITEFTFVGAQGEGGIVETSSIDENSEVYHPVLDECFRETLFTLELPAPEEGGRILVRYPFQLSQ